MVAVASAPSRVPLIQLSRVSKDYGVGAGVVHAMRDIDLSIDQGEFVAVVGASGSGKSTMMNVLGCLDRPTSGTYELAGIDVAGRKGDSRAIVRNRVIGFVFQGFNLLPRTTALENVELPLQYRGVGARERRRRAKAALEAVGLGSRIHHRQNQLSGGQQQRVAIARALVTDPPLLLADEPTGNLDTRTSLDVLALLQKLNRQLGITVVLVTHEREIAACASRVVEMRDGRIVSDARSPTPIDAAAVLAQLPPLGDGEDSAGPAGGRLGRATVVAAGSSSVPWSVYPMMWLGELSGELLAASYVALILRLNPVYAVWAGVLFGELAKAWAGSRWLRRTFRSAVTPDQRWHVAVGYTIGVTGLGLAVMTSLAMWSRTAEWLGLHVVLDFVGGVLARGWLVFVPAVAGTVAGIVLLRYLLLALLSPRR
jgi:putative ABC transport system ATP-binding protein